MISASDAAACDDSRSSAGAATSSATAPDESVVRSSVNCMLENPPTTLLTVTDER